MRKFVNITMVCIFLLHVSTVFGAERLSLGYIYSSYISHSQIIENTNNSINVVSPTCLDVNSKGRLEVNGLLDNDFICEMLEKGIMITPFLSNHWGTKRAHKMLDNPDLMVQDIVNIVNEYNLDGINIDIENISVKYKYKLSNFVRLIKEALPSGKIVSVAVAANPEKLSKTWVAAYDYESLAEYADYLVLMAYDEHSYGGAEGPVAGIDFVEKSLKTILESVSKDKVILGIPLYGRFWKEGAEKGGEAIVIGAVENLIKKYHLVPNFDINTMTPKLTVYLDGIKKNAFVNGRYLDEGTYNIWYENENSIKAKLKLVNEYNILGTALWALDNESKEFWDYYKENLNETNYENETEIRIRKRLEAYKKIAVARPIEIELKDVKLPKISFLKNNIRKLFFENSEIMRYKYILKENKFELIKSEKRKIKRTFFF